MTEPLIINQFNRGIAQSPHLGFGKMKLVDIESYPGAVKAGKQTVNRSFLNIWGSSYGGVSETFTVDAGTDVCTADGDISDINQTTIAVYLTTTDTLPAGLLIDTVYFMIAEDNNDFKLATTIANADDDTNINITDTGTGTHTIHSVDMGGIQHIVEDPRTEDVFAIDDNGRVWFQDGSAMRLLYNSALDDGSSALSQASGKGLVISRFSNTGSQNYLFAFRNGKIDVVNVYGNNEKQNPSWTNDWESLNTGLGSSNSHHAIKAQDDIIYFCDDRYVGSISEDSGQTFDPSNGATYTVNNQALDLPGYEIANWLEEHGTKLLIAGDTFGRIYPWDRLSDSFNLPINVPEKNVKKIKNIGGIVYILAGTSGNIYKTQGTYVIKFALLPIQMTDNSDSYPNYPIRWRAIGESNGNLIVGVHSLSSWNVNSGVYKIFQDGRIVLDQVPFSGSGRVTAILSTGLSYTIGYDNGVDYVGNDRYSSYEGQVESALYRVGTDKAPVAYSELEIAVAKGVSSGHVRISYRVDTDDSFTELSDFSMDGSVLYSADIGLIDIKDIQILAELDDAPELVEIRLYE